MEGERGIVMCGAHRCKCKLVERGRVTNNRD
jgi:hypothetical protein